MSLSDLITSPWAVTPEVLEVIADVYRNHVAGVRLSREEIQTRIGGVPRPGAASAYEVVDGVAVLPIVGLLAPRMNLMMDISGGTSTQIAGRNLMAAANDPSVEAIVLEISSPGGNVAGVAELAGLVRQVGQTKPVLAMASGVMASGGYWIGSAAREAYATERTTEIGSIGVATMHVDRSQALRDAGIVVTDIYAGKYKRMATDSKPLTDEARETIQARVDAIYRVFVEEVAAGRGVDPSVVLSRMADGRIFIGDEAVDAGLVDGIRTAGEIVARARELTMRSQSGHSRTTVTKKGNRMDIKTLEAEHPKLVAEIREQGYQAGKSEAAAEHAAFAEKALPEVTATARKEGAQQERERIAAIEAMAMPGHEDLIAQMKADGTTAEAAALKLVQAEKARRDATREGVRAAAPQPAAHAVPPTTSGAKTDQEKIAEAEAYAEQHRVDFVTAYHHLFEKAA